MSEVDEIDLIMGHIVVTLSKMQKGQPFYNVLLNIYKELKELKENNSAQ